MVKNEDGNAGMAVVDVVKAARRKIKCFVGVFTAESLPNLRILRHDTCFILIAQSHAIGVRIESKRIEVFDPLGFRNRKMIDFLFHFLYRHLPCKLLFVNTKIQADKSTNCAFFVLLYLYARQIGYSFAEYLNFFTAEFAENDTRVKSLYRGVFE